MAAESKWKAPDGKAYRSSVAWVRPERLVIHMIGQPGAGKSSMASEFGRAAESLGVKDARRPFVLPFQRGCEGLDVDQPVGDCPYCKGSEKGCSNCERPPGPGRVRLILDTYSDTVDWILWAAQHHFSPIILDPAPKFYEICMGNVMGIEGKKRKKVFDTPFDMPQGIGWNLVRRKLMETLEPISRAGAGLILISHRMYQEVRLGDAVQTLTVGGFTAKMKADIDAFVDVTMMLSVRKKAGKMEYFAEVRPQENSDTKDRFGYLPSEFSRGESALEAAQNFLRFYYNQIDKQDESK